MELIATNIRLPREDLHRLRLKAAQERKSLAQLFREAIQQVYGIGGKSPSVDPKRDPFHKLIGAWKSGLPDGATHHDRDIYGVEP